MGWIENRTCCASRGESSLIWSSSFAVWTVRCLPNRTICWSIRCAAMIPCSPRIASIISSVLWRFALGFVVICSENRSNTHPAQRSMIRRNCRAKWSVFSINSKRKTQRSKSSNSIFWYFVSFLFLISQDLNNQFEAERTSNRTLVVQAADRLQQIVELQTALELQRHDAQADAERLQRLEDSIQRVEAEKQSLEQQLHTLEVESERSKEQSKRLKEEMERVHVEGTIQKNVVDALTAAVKQRTAECTVKSARRG